MDYKHFSESEFASWDKEYRVNFFNSLGGFKSLNLLGTRNAQKQENLSIVSSVFHIGANPPLIGLIFRPAVVERHSLENILETGYFTLNHVHPQILKNAHQTSARYDRNESEFEHCQLTPEYLTDFFAPYVKESRMKIGLKLAQKIDLEINNTVMLIAHVVETHFDNNAIQSDGFVDLEKIQTVTVSGLDSYHSTQKIARLSYAKKGKEITEIW
jgi:flavin reductase (DIM6/NTAB) family NADH-FMN oxidoreductase RutF